MGPSRDAFPLGVSNAEAWLDLYPKATPDMASLYLYVSKPVWVKWRVCIGAWEGVTEHEFSREENGAIAGWGEEKGAIAGWGWGEAIPASLLGLGITIHLLGVRLLGSTLRLLPPGC